MLIKLGLNIYSNNGIELVDNIIGSTLLGPNPGPFTWWDIQNTKAQQGPGSTRISTNNFFHQQNSFYLGQS